MRPLGPTVMAAFTALVMGCAGSNQGVESFPASIVVGDRYNASAKIRGPSDKCTSPDYQLTTEYNGRPVSDQCHGPDGYRRDMVPGKRQSSLKLSGEGFRSSPYSPTY